MKLPPFEYRLVTDVDEAVELLAKYGDDAKVLAGGQSLLPLLALRLARPEMLIDINRIKGLGEVEVSEAGLRLGAIVRHRVVERSSEVVTTNPLLSAASAFIGHSAIRTRGTIGGTVAHGDPAAEMPATLVALDGEVELTGTDGTRTVASRDFFDGYLTTTIETGEIVTAITVPALPKAAGWSFQEFSRRNGDFAIAGVAAVVALDGSGQVAEVRIALSGMADVPVRAAAAEASLIGQQPSEELWAAAAADAIAPLSPSSDLHGSSAYRRHVAAALVRRALREAHRRGDRNAA